ncbi:MAG: Gldg family protein [Candidatus Omnitrophica bacterium]|nr:Gldg family protein [Candidatus Omnitrophota bacterium]
MKNLHHYKSIFVRELISYFNSPIAYIFIVVFVMLINSLFMMSFFLMGTVDMRYFFSLLPIVLCVFIPSITMRIWAEEKKGNTFELLLTFPMSSHKLVLGKFCASFVFYLLSLAGTLFIPVMLFAVGTPDIGPILGGYLGAVFMGAFFLSVGIFISGLCKEQIVAFIVAMLACFFFYLTGLEFFASLVDGWVPGIGSFLRTNFGMTRHFFSFEKGVIDNRDVFYFIIMTAAFLGLNYFTVEDRMRPKAKWIFVGAVAVCLAISMVFNSLIYEIPLGRYDLTEGKLYTAASATRKILGKLEAPVTVKLYISPPQKMPTAFKTLEQEIRDRLEELKVLAKGNLEYTVIHMELAQEQSSGEEETIDQRLQRKGIFPFQVQSIEQDEVGIRIVYSAIAISYKEKKEEILPRIISGNLHNLEYDLMSRIYRLTLDETPNVALVAPRNEQVDPFRILNAALRYEDYGVKRVAFNAEEPLPEDVDTLIIIDPQNLKDRHRYEISRFLYEGGNVIIAAQGFAFTYRPGPGGVLIIPQEKFSGINELMSQYGVELSDQLLMDKNHEVLNIGQGMAPRAAPVPVKAPMQIIINQDNMNQDVSITGRLSSMFYLFGTALKLDDGKMEVNQLKKTVLFRSSPESWEVKYMPVPLSKDAVLHTGEYTGNFPLSVLLEGQFPNVFEGEDIPDWETDETEAAEEKDAPGDKPLEPRPGKLLVVGCSSMFEEDLIQQGGALNFFINAVDVLTLGSDLINIRSHQPISRGMKKLSKVDKIWYRFLTIILVPLIVIFLGAMRAILRQRQKDLYLNNLE